MTPNWENNDFSAVTVTEPTNLQSLDGNRLAQVCNTPRGLAVTIPPDSTVTTHVVEGQIVLHIQEARQ